LVFVDDASMSVPLARTGTAHSQIETPMAGDAADIASPAMVRSGKY
jgi:hypothetical protein